MSEGISLIGATPVSFGLVTTPQLHWLTQRYNKLRETDPEAFQKVVKSDYTDAWVTYFLDF